VNPALDHPGHGVGGAVFVIVANILVDIAYTLLDPRVRLS
jgi:ABC-type dipeptide/oligopeptide/nickel transport system permease component